MTDNEIREWMEKNWIDCTIKNHLSIEELIIEFYIEKTDQYPAMDAIDKETNNKVMVIAVEIYKFLQHEGFIDNKGYII